MNKTEADLIARAILRRFWLAQVIRVAESCEAAGLLVDATTAKSTISLAIDGAGEA